MKKTTLDEAIYEAKRFLKAAIKLKEQEARNNRSTFDWSPKEQGAVKRASMDLTRKLADLRLGR